MPFDGKELFWHWTMVRFVDLAKVQNGVWIDVECGGRELADRRCIRSKPFEGENPCSTCGWKGEVIKHEQSASRT